MSTIIGYTTGVFDLFHIGHLNILKKAKEHCDYLIVGVTTDEIAFEMKGKKPVLSFGERLEIVNSIKYVDKAVAKEDIDNIAAWRELKFDVFFKGDDWKGTEKGRKLENYFAEFGIQVIYFPYTEGTSSTFLREVLNKIKTS
ncbi:adenylyltransferase/cytidyltransferase family protein [Sphingobacterium chuzhouense]|uniref:Adenylyltransferase/cytidyltransferase family protein n=1 Tax=Sphingobacterium chuzhouense TaxID=1742264 RepID=A0ABR7XTJ7_9SPHI|nr:adenylyltransferase/cytidyltransferase family protein [Sphingobacterium chuzhouense]MBD1422503.1 adenylyltransferase/cytidyltransferase family protein [Sphingobacterium chuzhouense]